MTCFLVRNPTVDAIASRGVEARCRWQAASVMLVVVVLLLLLVEEVVSKADSSSSVGIPLERATLRPGVGRSSCSRWQNNHSVTGVAIHACSVKHQTAVVLSAEHGRRGHRRFRPIVFVLPFVVIGSVVRRMMRLVLVVLLLRGCWEARPSGALLLSTIEDVRVQTSAI